MGRTVSIDKLSDAIAEEFDAYSKNAAEEVKDAVKDASSFVREEIQANAPVRTGAYRRSWAVKKLSETPEALVLSVHSKTRYRLTHLLENGHAKRGGGRVEGRPHIAPAEEKGVKKLEDTIRKKLEGL